ncbi:o-succinylbenzoate synthase [Paralimibaculum aggregatum]|uniref:o-succinylbenzoate synthase n=2 Tax=Paralimibaculum aggregatum TaxID=3036245 RepID=A0ABQ6LSG6_9RHOB|nr:o-succinylbenzoate synthase [Limibaculum sp. NKW23]
MHIDEIRVFHVSMPLKEPWRTAFSEEHAIDTVLVRMRSGDLVGWGEAAPYAVPQFSPEWTTGCLALIRDVFAPLLVGQEIASGAALQARLASFKGNYFAKAALDTAWWDLHAKARGLPLWRLIGGAAPEVRVGADIPVQADRAALLAHVGRAVAGGFGRIKLKYRRDSTPEMVAAVMAAAPGVPVHIDCNAGFGLEDLPVFRALDGLGLAMIEQPLGWTDLIDHARLQAELETPLCLDESITSLEAARQAVETGATRKLNIKHGRVGGLTNALAIHRYCREAGIPCWVGGMLESFVGQGVSLALATLPGLDYPADIFPDGRLYAADLAGPALDLSGPGEMTAPERPGHGFAPLPGRLAAVLVAEG